ncbi:nuclear transport factor 2 family protein [Caenispirillum salinarum]|uniref:nuclear transport factor 2 family protein n=1 Tax=Caenispirillum salinarum TaxID=859058 RepID=UPI00384BF6D1
MPETTAALFAVEAFYSAFAARDFSAMRGIWATEGPLTCIHPGAPPLTERDEVLESWEAILANPETPDVRCLSPEIVLYGDTAVCTCLEDVGGELLAATNVLVREGPVWKLVHHQAGPLTVAPDFEPEPAGGEGPIN